jgi:Protein of unknown function (DUF1573)
MIETHAEKTTRKPLSWLSVTLLFAGAGLVLLVGLAFYSFGSIGSAVAYVSGERLLLDRCSKSFGEVRPGERPLLRFDLTNTSDRAIAVLGARTQCTCLFAEGLPLSIPPGSRRAFHVAVKTGSRVGKLQEPIQLYTDFPGQRELRLTVHGRILSSAAQPSREESR